MDQLLNPSFMKDPPVKLDIPAKTLGLVCAILGAIGTVFGLFGLLGISALGAVAGVGGPKEAYVSRVVASNHAAGRAYVSKSGNKQVFRSLLRTQGSA